MRVSFVNVLWWMNTNDFVNVVYVYVGKKSEKFLWLGKKVTDNNRHACTVHADQEDLTTMSTSFCL